MTLWHTVGATLDQLTMEGIAMPNHVTTEISITGPRADQLALVEAIKGDESAVDFNRILPMPPELRDIKTGHCTISGQSVKQWREIDGKKVAIPDAELDRYMREFGAADWYRWANDNWGTKWNAYDVEVSGRPKSIYIRMTTAWDSPHPIIRELARRFPALTFRCHNSGEIDDPSAWVLGPGSKVRSFAH